MKYKILLHSDGNLSVTSPGVTITHKDIPKTIGNIEAGDNFTVDKIKKNKKGKKLEIEIPGQAKKIIDIV
jgi:hypothetical protein